MVVLEDVDLIAQDRSHGPLLFTLLDAMDGVGGDADVTFLLTTNRASELEKALADRPGRVDLAVEIPLPDSTGREELLRRAALLARPDEDVVVGDEELTTALRELQEARSALPRSLLGSSAAQ
ncbi:AAA family ATPase [Amycolatopsis mongoliensis]|uniref:AAA family ATPase n=1 Tax=Amycolatopsis mongoliensis TaxID=715475 RepID=A0A9Y2JX15_9PSEU|nr:AAA family ATPase [Amycolatopsis sp. 4-36]WIY05047.1 AAA family ATPase [Amycolatopsis sp. 4-36]